MDPLKGSAWSAPSTVAGFAKSQPNPVLMQYAADLLDAQGSGLVVDIGCGAGRNAIPLAALGWRVLGLDLSWPMVQAAAARTGDPRTGGRAHFVLAPHHALPVATGVADLVIAHGIWNLSRSTREFRAGVREAGRVARARARAFVFTFSRQTIPEHVAPAPDDPYVFTTFSGQPQCFLTGDELIAEMREAGFEPDPAVPLTEYNRPAPGSMRAGGPPVIYECGFRRVG